MTEVLRRIIPDWKSFAQKLGLDEALIQEIDGQPGLSISQVYFNEVLNKWIQVRGRDASLVHILVACEEVNRALANKLLIDEKMLQTFPSKPVSE